MVSSRFVSTNVAMSSRKLRQRSVDDDHVARARFIMTLIESVTPAVAR